MRGRHFLPPAGAQGPVCAFLVPCMRHMLAFSVLDMVAPRHALRISQLSRRNSLPLPGALVGLGAPCAICGHRGPAPFIEQQWAQRRCLISRARMHVSVTSQCSVLARRV